jgi:hypothetical protein
MPVLNNDKRFSCWECKHYQAIYAQGEPTNVGECRCVPPAACCDTERDEPIFPGISSAVQTWCSAWMQRRAGTGLGTRPTPAP